MAGPINLLIKPASGGCNMRCQYCFYADEMRHRSTPSYGIMKDDVLETIIKKALEYANGQCTIAFQGGEPTLTGLEFYKKAVTYARKHNVHALEIHFAIQTNGYVIDREWAEFFAANNFLVGLSLDGPKEIHDTYRFDAFGKGTFAKVMRASQLFDANKVEYNILTVVTNKNASKAQAIYQFYKKHHMQYQQYIPCLDSLDGEMSEFSLTPDNYALFLKNMFDCWYQDMVRGEYVFNRYFENLVGMLYGHPPESCGMGGNCSLQYVVEADGSVYPCDFYVLDEWKIGSFCDNTMAEIDQVRWDSGFLQISEDVNEDCPQCEWCNICRGGCRRYREPYREGHLARNYYCETYKEFFAYAMPRLQEIGRLWMNRK